MADYSAKSFWSKCKKSVKSAGGEVMEKALWLYYAAQRPETPAWAKTTIYGALAYFILPVDAIPDLMPVVGYTDDLGALAAAVATCSAFINKGVRADAKKKLEDWGF